MDHPLCIHVLCLDMKYMYEKGWFIFQAFTVKYEIKIYSQKETNLKSVDF